MTMNNKLTHVDREGMPKMVDVSNKSVTKREAKARCLVHLGKEIINELLNGEIHTKKGPVFQTAIIAGVMAAKKTSDIIPFCHPLSLNKCDIEISPIDEMTVEVVCVANVDGKTGIEMEALTGCTAAALTIYDMCKAMSHDIVISEIKLLSKTGGKKDFIRDA